LFVCLFLQYWGLISVLYHLSHAPSCFYCSYFSVLYFLPGARPGPQLSYLRVSGCWDYRCTSPCSAYWLRWGHLSNFLASLALNLFLPISAYLVIEIIGIHHQAWPREIFRQNKKQAQVQAQNVN
jgi:hypothetical protein